MNLPRPPLPVRAGPLPVVLLVAGLATLGIRGRAEEPLPSTDRLKTSPVLRHLRPNPMPPGTTTGPAQTVANMYVPEGFRAELVVGEPDLHQPIAFAWDERGRIWVAEAYSYPQKRPAGQGQDKLVIFEDRDGDGRFETRKVFAEGLNLVSGFELGFGGVWVGAAPELLFLADQNHDDLPDGPPKVLLDGFGYQDTHECLNSFLWGPDGWLYGNQGVFNLAHIGKPGAPDSERTELRAGVWRYHPVRHTFEVFAHGGSNPWGLDYDERGQLFMTHCRSYFGRGLTTHVLQGGQFWNQANANYAPYIVADPPADFPEFRNYLLASARYDHGAGGAGTKGSDAIFGGHSHVGTMIYQGDNWPDEFRGHLFTHNLGGHQMNHQVNRREGSGFDTVHAGRDQLFCSDPKYVAVDLQYGPDGAVYFIDWYDPQHCHNPNTERWDRSNGRIYRLQWSATYRPIRVDLANRSDADLAGLHTHRNEWFVRTARRLLQERAQSRPIADAAIAGLADLFLHHVDPAIRLRALWSLHAIGHFTVDVARQSLRDPDEFVRGWSIQLGTDTLPPNPAIVAPWLDLARQDPSPVVRRQLASAIQRVPDDTAWALIEALARHGEDRNDRNLPFLLWDGMAQRMPQHVDRALAVAGTTPLTQLADWTAWYAATLEGEGLNRVVASLAQLDPETLRRRLAGVDLALAAKAGVAAPSSWSDIAPTLYAHADPRVRRLAERIAAVFGDASLFPQLRAHLEKRDADPELRRHAFAVLSRAQDPGSLPTFVGLLDDPIFRSAAIPLLSRFDSPGIADALIQRFPQLSPADKSAALNTLTSRVTPALALLDAVAGARIPRDQLTAFHVRALSALKNTEVDRRVLSHWGRILPSPAEKQAKISQLEKVYNEAPLWAYSATEGKSHFLKLCASCHRVGELGTQLGPELTGAGKQGIRYFLENILDPNAVIGGDFQMTTVETKQGEVLSGLLSGEAGSSLTLRTPAGPVVIAKAEVAKRETSDRSLMPEGLLESLGDREQIELLKFLLQD